MEVKCRTKSQPSFAKAHQQSMKRLRSMTKFNGILANVQVHNQGIKTVQQSKPCKSIINKPSKQLATRLPPIVKTLKIQTLNNIRSIMPTQGYVQFELDEKYKSGCFLSTISKDGVILNEHNNIQFLTVDELERRCKNIDKLKQIETIKHINILRPFFIWKQYSKLKRFAFLKQNLKNTLNVNLFCERSHMYATLTNYFENNKFVNLQQTLVDLKMTSFKKKSDNHSLLNVFFTVLQSGYESLMYDQHGKANPNLNIEFIASSRLCFLTFRELCQQFTTQMTDLISEALTKHFYYYRCTSDEFTNFLYSYSKDQPSLNFMTKISLHIHDDESVIQVKVKGTSYFDPLVHAHDIKFQLQSKLFQIVRCSNWLEREITQISNKVIQQVVKKFDFKWQPQNPILFDKVNKLKQVVKFLSDKSKQNFNNFLQFLKQQIAKIKSIDMSASNKIIEVERKISIIQAIPETLNFGLLLIDMHHIKKHLKTKIGLFWKQISSKLPKDIESILSGCQKAATQMQSTIDSTVWSIQDIVFVKKEINRHDMWKQNNLEKIKDIEAMIQIVNKMNSKISQQFSVRFIQFKQKMNMIGIKIKAFERSLPQRLKRAGEQKNVIFNSIESHIAYINNRCSQIRKIADTSKILQILYKQQDDYFNRIRSDIQILEELLKTQNNLSEPRFIQCLNRTKQTYSCFENQILFYISIIKHQELIFQQVQEFLNMSGHEQIIEVAHPEGKAEQIRAQISIIKKRSQNLGLSLNPLLCAIIENYKVKLDFFRAIQILKKSNQFQSSSNIHVQKTVRQIYESNLHIEMHKQFLQIEERIKVLQDFVEQISSIQVKFESHKLFADVQINNPEGTLNSIHEAIQLLNQSIQVQNNKIKSVSKFVNDNWKKFIQQDNAKTVQNLKACEKAVILLRKICEIKDSYMRNKDVIYAKYNEIEKKVKQKWTQLFSEFEDSSLSEFKNKLHNFENVLQQIEEIQMQMQAKIQVLLQKTYVSMPMLYLFQRDIVFKAIFDPVYFLQYFFHYCDVKYEKQIIVMTTRQHQQIRLSVRQSDINIKLLFTEIESKIKSYMLHFQSENSSTLSLQTLLDYKYFGIPLQVINFIDLMRLQGWDKSGKPTDKIQQQIDRITKKIGSMRSEKNNYSIYNKHKLSLLLMNRIEARDSFSTSTCKLFKPKYSFCENEGNFYFEMCNSKTKICYEFVDYAKNSMMVTNSQLYAVASIHRSFHNPQSTLVLPNSAFLDAYSFRVMRYQITMPLLNNRLHSILFAVLRTNVIVNFEHHEQIEFVTFEKLHNQLLKFYEQNQQKRNRDRKAIVNVKWPIFITLPNMNNKWFQSIRPEVRSFFRNIRPAVPQISSMLQWIIRDDDSSITNNLIKITSESEGNQKKSRYSDVRRVFIKFMKIYQKMQQNRKQERANYNTKVLQKLLKKVLKNAQITDQRYKVTYHSFMKSIKNHLFTHLNGIKYDETQLSQEVLSFFQIKSSVTIVTEQFTASSAVILSTKTIINEPKQNEKPKNLKQDYYAIKADQIKQTLKSTNIVALLGNPFSGKTYFLKNYVFSHMSDEQQAEKVVVLHPTALGPQLWTEQETPLQSKKYQTTKMHYIIQGDLQAENYFNFRKMLDTKHLYYQSGARVSLSSASKIIFELENSLHIDPSLLVQIQWIHLSFSQLKWQIVLKNKIEHFKNMIIKQIMKTQQYNTAYRQVVQGAFDSFQKDCENVLFEIFYNQTDKLESYHRTRIIVNTFNLVHTFDNIYRTTIDQQIKNSAINRQQTVFLSLFLYCLHFTVRSAQSQCELSLLSKVNAALKKIDYFELDDKNQKVMQCIPSIQRVANQQNVLVFKNPSILNPSYFSLSSSFKLVPNHKITTQALLTSNLLKANVNILLFGPECSGKTTFAKLLQNQNYFHDSHLNVQKGNTKRYQIQSVSLKTFQMFLVMLQKICKIKHPSDKIVIFVEDCALETKNDDCKLAKYLKYLWQNKCTIQNKELIKRNGLSFLIQLNQSQLQNAPTQFLHLFPMSVPQVSETECIYNYLLCSLWKGRHSNLQSLSSYQHSQLTAIFALIQQLKHLFQMTSVRDWKHRYGVWLITEAIDILQSLIKTNRIPKFLTVAHQCAQNNSQILQRQSQPILLRQVHKIIVKLVGFQLDHDQSNVFRKFTSHVSDRIDEKSQTQNLVKYNLQLDQYNFTNITRIAQAIQLRNFVFIQNPVNDQLRHLIINSLSTNKELKLLQIGQLFIDYKHFANFIHEKVKLHNKKFHRLKLVLYFTLQLLKASQYQVLSFFDRFREEQKQIKSNLDCEFCFATEFEKDDINFMKELKQFQRLRRRAAVICMVYDQKPGLSSKVIKSFTPMQNPKTQSIIPKMIKIFENLKSKMEQKKIKNSPSFQSRKQTSGFFMDQLNTVTQSILSDSKLTKIGTKVLTIYCKQLSQLQRKERIITLAIQQLKRLIKQHQDLSRRQKNLELKLIFDQIQLNKLKQKYDKTLNIYNTTLEQYQNCTQYKQQKSQLKQIEKAGNVVRQRKNLKKGFKQALLAMNRTQVSEVKYICSNSKQAYADLSEGICLALTGEYDCSLFNKILMDINLINKIRQCKFTERTTQCLTQIANKIKQYYQKMEDQHILRNIVEWAYFGAKLQLLNRQFSKQKDEKGIKKIESINKSQENKQQYNGESNNRLQQICQEIELDLKLENQQVAQQQFLVNSELQQVQKINAILGRLQKFQYFTTLLQAVSQIPEIMLKKKQKLFPSIIYNYLCLEILPCFSSYQLIGVKQKIKQAIKQEGFDLKLQTLKFDHEVCERLQKLNLMTLSQGCLLSNQRLKFISFLEAIKLKQSLIIVNRNNIFSQILTKCGAVQYKSQKTLDIQIEQFQCAAIEIQDSQWKQFKQQLTKLTCSKNNSHSKATSMRHQLKISQQEISDEFIISNSLGIYDFRLANKCAFRDKFSVIDFGIDSEDIFQHVLKSLSQHLGLCIPKISQQNLFQNLLIKEPLLFQGLTIEKSYVKLNNIATNVCQIQKLNTETEDKMKNSNYIDVSFVSKFKQLYQIYELAVKFSLKDKQVRMEISDQKQSVSTPSMSEICGIMSINERFINLFHRCLNKKSSYASSQKEIISQIYQLLRDKLLKINQIGDYFKLLYYFRVYLPKNYPSISQKQINSFLNLPPLTVRLKKLLTTEGMNIEQTELQLMGFKNFKMEVAVKHILHILNQDNRDNPQNRAKNGVNFNIRDQDQLIDADILWQSYILQKKDINYLQKLVLARLFIPSKLNSILHEQITKMTDVFQQSIAKSYNQNCLKVSPITVCQCDVDFWRSRLPIQIVTHGHRNHRTSVFQQHYKQSALPKFYSFYNDIQYGELLHLNRNSKIILFVDLQHNLQQIKTDLEIKRIAYKSINIEDVIEHIWKLSDRDREICQIFQSLPIQWQNKQQDFVSKYLTYLRFVKQIKRAQKPHHDKIQTSKSIGPKIKSDQKLAYNNHQFQTNKSHISDETALNSKQIFMGLRKAEASFQDNCSTLKEIKCQMKDNQLEFQQNYVYKFMKILSFASWNVDMYSIRGLAEDCRLNFGQILHGGQQIKQQYLRQEILRLYDTIRSMYLSPAAQSDPLNFLSKSKGLLMNNNFYKFHSLLYKYCQLKNSPGSELLIQSNDPMLTYKKSSCNDIASYENKIEGYQRPGNAKDQIIQWTSRRLV